MSIDASLVYGSLHRSFAEKRRKFPVRVTQKRGGIVEDDGCAMYEGYAISVLPKPSIVKRKGNSGDCDYIVIALKTGEGRMAGEDAGLLIKPVILCRVTWFRFNDNRGCVHVYAKRRRSLRAKIAMNYYFTSDICASISFDRNYFSSQKILDDNLLPTNAIAN